MGRFVAEIIVGRETRLEQLLQKLGATDIVRLDEGYLSWSGDDEWTAVIKQCRGVRTVWPLRDAEVQSMKIADSSTLPSVAVNDTVSIRRGAVAMVGRVKQIEAGKAVVVTALFGRPLELEVPIQDIHNVSLPEVWQ